jgi:hypothetical protein
MSADEAQGPLWGRVPSIADRQRSGGNPAHLPTLSMRYSMRIQL